VDQKATLGRVVPWALEEDNIRVAVLTGSVARGDDQFDSLSDLDIELYVKDPRPLLERSDWYERFGQVLVVEELDDPDWHPTRLVYYVDGKIDFMIGHVDHAKTGIEYEQPYRILIDKDDLGEHMRFRQRRETPPLPSEFLRSVNWFYAAALMEAKSIVREEPWLAYLRDRDLKDELLKMVEWDHSVRHRWERETLRVGLHLRDRLDDDVLSALDSCWADFSVQEMQRALRASIALFNELATRTAHALGMEAFDARATLAEIERILALDGRRSR